MPPYLAGRADEQSLFLRFFRTLRRGVSVPTEILVYGPRGSGKTTLLRWAEEQARGEGLGFDRLDSDEIGTPADLISGLDLETWLPNLTPDGVSTDEAGQHPGGLPPLAEALEARAKDDPWIVVVDEAQFLDPRVGRWLLNAAPIAGREAPFLLILAGGPSLHARLSAMGASCWSRAESVRLGRLAANATAEAARRPLAEEGIEIGEEALARIVRESHGYPYFVQLWGQAIWNRVRESPAGERRVTVAVVESATADFEAEKRCHFGEIVSGLATDGVLPAAREVAIAFRGGARLSYADFREAVSRGVDDAGRTSRAEAADALEHLGFVWQTEGVPTWEPGIPSLMDYLLEHAPAPDGDAATR